MITSMENRKFSYLSELALLKFNGDSLVLSADEGRIIRCVGAGVTFSGKFCDKADEGIPLVERCANKELLKNCS